MPVDATDPSIRYMPIMTDADMAMKMDPPTQDLREVHGRSGLLRTPSPAPGSS
jgi:catalase (peroxidase I)